MDKTDRAKRAAELFREGYNCAQSVVLAFEDQLPLSREHLAAMSSSFGGGMGRLRQVCGAVSGMFILAGFAHGTVSPADDKAKAEHYRLIQELAAEFTCRNDSIICRELLGLDLKTGQADDFIPSKRTESYYASRPCEQFVYDAAEIVSRCFRAENPQQDELK